MENEILPTILPVQPLPQVPLSDLTPPSTNWYKILLFIILGLIIIAGSIFVGIQIGKNQSFKSQSTKKDLASLPEQKILLTPTLKVLTSTVLPTQSVSVANPTLIPATPTPTSFVPLGWLKHSFPNLNLIIYAPKDWKSNVEFFPNVPSHLIRFWQGASQDTSTVQLNIKNNWDNTGDAQYLNRNFQINEALYASKVDPKKMTEISLDRYQTNYHFEKNGKVYILNCVHNWIAVNYNMCESLLKSIEFLE